jgi:hypothetical protein
LFNYILTIFPDTSKEEEKEKLKLLNLRKNELLKFSQIGDEGENRKSRRVIFIDPEEEERLRQIKELEDKIKEEAEDKLLNTVGELRGGKTQLGKFLFSLKDKMDKDRLKTKLKTRKKSTAKSKDDINSHKNEELSQIYLKGNLFIYIF